MHHEDDGNTAELTTSHMSSHSRSDPSLGDNVRDDRTDTSYTALHGSNSTDFHWLDVAKLRFDGQFDNDLVEEVR